MGSITGKRIRETQGRAGNGPLVYQPQNALKQLATHDRLWSLLGENVKPIIPPKWMKGIIDALGYAPSKEKLKDYLRQWEPRIKDPEFSPVKASKPLETPSKAPASPLDLGQVIGAYNLHYALTVYARRFPRWITDQRLTIDLISEVLTNETGSLMLPGSKTPCELYATYRETLNPVQIADLSVKVSQVQSLRQFGDLWITYLKVHKVKQVGEIRRSMGQGYQGWREANRHHGAKGAAISTTMIGRELTYLRNVLTHAQGEGWIQANPMIGVKPVMDTRDQGESLIEKPYTLEEWKGILETARNQYRDMEDSDPLLPARKLNYLSILFLSLCGCRPKELNQWTVDPLGKVIQFVGGKTKNAKRRIKLSPTLAKLIKVPQLADNTKSTAIAQRISNYLRKYQNPDYTSYRFRHSVASALLTIGELTPPEIAYFLGHESSVITETRYGNLGIYDKGEIKAFWKWLNEEYFKSNPL